MMAPLPWQTDYAGLTVYKVDGLRETVLMGGPFIRVEREMSFSINGYLSCQILGHVEYGHYPMNTHFPIRQDITTIQKEKVRNIEKDNYEIKKTLKSATFNKKTIVENDKVQGKVNQCRSTVIRKRQHLKRKQTRRQRTTHQ